MKKKFEDMSLDELRAELKRLRGNLCDLEDMHSFTFGRTSVHIGAEKAQNMQREFEEECNEHSEKIAAVERLLKVKGKG